MSDARATEYVQSVFAKVPIWMTRAVGAKFLVSMIMLADAGAKALLEALYARFPGVGTPTALPYIGRDRGMIRGMSDTDLTFGARLIQWLDRWRIAGSQLAICIAVQEYCSGSPKVKVVNRTGRMTTLNSDGSSSFADVTWNWDSLSHPQRAGFWSEIWIIVYTPPWAISGPLNTNTPADCGIGQLCPRVDVDALRGLFTTWKSAHTFIRGVLWAYDATLFDPSSPSTMPDGTWGSWGYGRSHRQLSGRGLLEQSNKLRTWEPDREPTANFHLFEVGVNP